MEMDMESPVLLNGFHEASTSQLKLSRDSDYESSHEESEELMFVRRFL